MNRTAIKITVLVAFLCTSLLLLLNFLVLNGSQKAFVTVFKGFSVDAQGHIVPHYDKLQVTSPLADDVVSPIEIEFRKEFVNSLALVNIIGVFASFLIGFVAAQIITKPLKNLQGGIKKLQKSDYKINLEETGTKEVDELITEFNNLAMELAKVEDLRKDLISDTSHELKTPLTSLVGQLEGIKDGLLKPDAPRINALLVQVNRLNDLIERLQEFTRLRAKTAKLDLEEIKLKSFLVTTLSEFKAELKKKKIEVNYNIVPEDLAIKADKLLLERLFDNLIQNAIKYSKCSEITIAADANEIVFKDNGTGVPKEHLDYIFERFYRVEKSRNRDTGGLGLGLAIVKEIVEAHGWKIRVQNGAEGGLEFKVKLSQT